MSEKKDLDPVSVSILPAEADVDPENKDVFAATAEVDFRQTGWIKAFIFFVKMTFSASV